MNIKLDELYNLRKSFTYAFRGIVFCIRYERNMRIHIVTTVFVLFFALYFYKLTSTELIVLILTCVLVMSLEIVNTAIEVLTDKASPEFSILARVAKDTAAGAVLLSALASLVIGVILFWDVATFGEIVAYFLGNIVALLVLLITMILSCIFIFTGKKRRKRGTRKNRENK